MTIQCYDQGDVVRVVGTFTDPLNADVPIDPDVINLTIENPSGTTTTYVYGVDSNVIKDSVGVYHADIDCNLAGIWIYRWWSTGAGQASEEEQFYVEPAEAV